MPRKNISYNYDEERNRFIEKQESYMRYALAAAGLLASVFSGGVGTFFSYGFVVILYRELEKLSDIYIADRYAREEIGELIIASYLYDKFVASKKGWKLYSRLQENRIYIPPNNDYIDILLVSPTKRGFAISVKYLRGENTVFYDTKRSILRYRNRKGTKHWKIDPISEIREQSKYIVAKGIVREQPFLFVTFPEPITVSTEQNVATQVGELEVLKVNDVWVIEQVDLEEILRFNIRRRKFIGDTS